ncbi:hypothetical protein ACJX0J_018739 [Zea mays]
MILVVYVDYSTSFCKKLIVSIIAIVLNYFGWPNIFQMVDIQGHRHIPHRTCLYKNMTNTPSFNFSMSALRSKNNISLKNAHKQTNQQMKSNNKHLQHAFHAAVINIKSKP